MYKLKNCIVDKSKDLQGRLDKDCNKFCRYFSFTKDQCIIDCNKCERKIYNDSKDKIVSQIKERNNYVCEKENPSLIRVLKSDFEFMPVLRLLLTGITPWFHSEFHPDYRDTWLLQATEKKNGTRNRPHIAPTPCSKGE